MSALITSVVQGAVTTKIVRVLGSTNELALKYDGSNLTNMSMAADGTLTVDSNGTSGTTIAKAISVLNTTEADGTNTAAMVGAGGMSCGGSITCANLFWYTPATTGTFMFLDGTVPGGQTPVATKQRLGTYFMGYRFADGAGENLCFQTSLLPYREPGTNVSIRAVWCTETAVAANTVTWECWAADGYIGNTITAGASMTTVNVTAPATAVTATSTSLLSFAVSNSGDNTPVLMFRLRRNAADSYAGNVFLIGLSCSYYQYRLGY